MIGRRAISDDLFKIICKLSIHHGLIAEFFRMSLGQSDDFRRETSRAAGRWLNDGHRIRTRFNHDLVSSADTG